MDYQLLYPLVGRGLLTSDGDAWLRQRRLMQPAFHRQRITALGQMMVDETLDALARWQGSAQQGDPIAVDQEMMRLTLTIVGKALLSIDLGDEASQFGQAFKQANARFGYENMVSVMLPWLPTRQNRQFKAAIQTMDSIVYEIIARRRAEPGDYDDLLTMLLGARDEETGEGMSDRQLRNEMMTILLAGHETTANALTWTFYLLSQHLEVAARLHAEVEGVLAGRPPGIDDLAHLPLTRMVLQEAMRLYPPVWSIARRAVEADDLAGYPIPAGSVIHISLYALHRHPRLWDQAETFRPERFDEAEVEQRHKFAYLPFSAGPRKCIGDQFAMTEGQLILASVAQRFDLALAPDQRIDTAALITLNPKHGMKMIPELRSQSVSSALGPVS
jgi:cytochrome P450